jgi:hypothetical protein
MTILLLHGWQSVPGGGERTFLAEFGQKVMGKV